MSEKLVKKIKFNGSDTEYIIRDASTYQSLNDEQALHFDTELNPMADGLYNGNEVPNNTLFIRDSGDIQKYSYTSEPGGYIGPYNNFPSSVKGSVLFKDNLYLASDDYGGQWGVYKYIENEQTFTRVCSSGKVSNFLANSNVCIAYSYWDGTYLISSTGNQDDWESYDPSVVGKDTPFFCPNTTLGDTLIIYTNSTISAGWTGYCYSEDDGDSWSFVDYSEILQDNDEGVHNLLSTGDKLFLYTSKDDSRDRFDYVYVSTDGKTWSNRYDISSNVASSDTDYTGRLQASGNKIFFFKSWSHSAWYSIDGYTFVEFTEGVPYEYMTPQIRYTPESSSYIGITHTSPSYITSSDGIFWEESSTALPDGIRLDDYPLIVGGDYVIVYTDMGWYKITTSLSYTRTLTTVNKGGVPSLSEYIKAGENVGIRNITRGYSVHGSGLSISDAGVIDATSTPMDISNYVYKRFPIMVNTSTTKNFEIITKINMSQYSSPGCIVCLSNSQEEKASLILQSESSKFYLYATSDGESYDICEHDEGSLTIENNTDYWIKITCGNQLSLSEDYIIEVDVSTDGEDWQTINYVRESSKSILNFDTISFGTNPYNGEDAYYGDAYYYYGYYYLQDTSFLSDTVRYLPMNNNKEILEVYTNALPPILTWHSPSSSDIATPGQIWCDMAAECVYICVIINSGYASWKQIAAA